MISEEKLVHYLDMNPFSIPKFSKRHDLSGFLKTALVICQAIAFYAITDFVFEIKVFDIDTFMKKTSFVYILVTILIEVYLILSPNRVFWFDFEGLTELNSTLDLHKSSDSGVVVPIIIFFLLAHVSAFTCFTLSSGFVFLTHYLLLISTNYTVTAIKHVLSKSLKAVIDKMIQEDRPVKVVHSFRRVLAHNQTIVEIYSFSVLVGSSGGVFMVVISLTDYWKVYGLYKSCFCFESSHPFLTIASQHFAMFQLLLLGIVSTKQLCDVSLSRFLYRIYEQLLVYIDIFVWFMIKV